MRLFCHTKICSNPDPEIGQRKFVGKFVNCFTTAQWAGNDVCENTQNIFLPSSQNIKAMCVSSPEFVEYLNT